jgi:hypothetical protein
LKRLHWLPIDIPKFEYCKEIVQDFKCEFIPPSALAFAAQRLTVCDSNEDYHNYKDATWRNDLTYSQQKLKEYVDLYLPFTKLVTIKMHNVIKESTWHIDFRSPDRNPELYTHNQQFEPCGYRIVIQGSRSGELEVRVKDDILRPTMPEDTDCYVLGHTTTLHTNTGIPKDRYILFCHGWVDPVKHENLIARSLKKYEQYAIWENKDE